MAAPAARQGCANLRKQSVALTLPGNFHSATSTRRAYSTVVRPATTAVRPTTAVGVAAGRLQSGVRIPCRQLRSSPTCLAPYKDYEIVRSDHFKVSSHPHPLADKKTYLEMEEQMADKLGRQQNHIWTKAELDAALKTWDERHKPTELSDRIMHGIMYYGMYHPFNFLTGYRHDDPSPQSIAWRLIILESFAGVPGFVAAGMRHFRSLRYLQRDYGWINTLLEEAENERMHLLVCLKMFEAGPITRFMCIAAQITMTPFLMLTYFVKPRAMHRFVGYLEQTACSTYKNIIDHLETPGTQLHTEWAHLPAPPIAKGYWKLGEDARWLDALKCMYADETHHRDVNHTFASMPSDDPNPFLQEHRENAVRAWRLQEAEQILREHRGA